jgi:tripartite ATP-independent transporter DctM subunit
LIIGVPVAFSLLFVGLAGLSLVIGWGPMLGILTTLPFFSTAQYSFTPMPLFIFMASLIFATGIGTTMYDSAAKWFSKSPGGLGISTTVASTLFGTLTGSSLVTAAMFTKVSVPEMRKHGYNAAFAYGLTCASSVIGMLIPPSMLAILYGILAEESISKLFIAGIGPGVLTALGFSLLIFLMVKRNPELAPVTEESFTMRQKVNSLRGIWTILLVAFLMLGGIFSGVFTVTEGGAMGAFSIFVIVLITRKLSWKIMKWVSLDTVKINTMIFLLLIGATLFSRFVTITGITSKSVEMISGAGLPGWGVLSGFMVVYIVLGCFLDPISILSITLPLVLPVAEAYGWNPIYFAMLIIYNMHIGTITPAVGLTLFAVKGAAGNEVAFEDIVRGTAPFYILMVVLLVILSLFETLTVGLANWM